MEVSTEELVSCDHPPGEETEGITITPLSELVEAGVSVCSICDQTFVRPSHLTRHIEACHGNQNNFKCTECPASFNRKDTLTRHLATQHSDNPRKFKCTVPECDKDFNRKDHLTKHLRGFHKIQPEDAGDFEEGGEEDEEFQTKDPLEEERVFRCTNTGCDAVYSCEEHLHRHLSRGHTQEIQLPVWGHSVFEGAAEGETLCMFCCTKFQMSAGLEVERQRKAMLANDPSFGRFCEAAIRQQRKRMNANSIIKSLNCLNNVSVCQRCFNKIGYAMGTKSCVDEVEGRVEELRRKLAEELKSLESEVDQFYEEMRLIDEVVNGSDSVALEEYFEKIEGAEEKEQSGVVLLLRDGISTVMNDVEVYVRKIKGDQGDGRRTWRRRRVVKKKKKKRVNPMMHVKVEGMEEEKTGVEGETPRKQPVREARIRTEEFLRNLFEKAGEEMEIKEEVPSDKEEEKEEACVPAVEGDGTEKPLEGESSKEGDGGEVIGKKQVAALQEKKKSEVEKKSAEEGTATDGETLLPDTQEALNQIEEILIEGDDLDDLFYEDGESDEDFNLDAAHDDVESLTESSSESDDEDDDDAEDYSPAEPSPKRARTSTGRRGGRGRRSGSDYDPFNFKKSRSSNSSTPRRSGKFPLTHNIDMTGMSEFKKRLLCRILKKSSKPSQEPVSASGEPDPRVNFRFDYLPGTDALMLGDVQVFIHESSQTLQCGKCGYNSCPTDKPRRSVPRIMYNHILGKHLFAFQCPQCDATLGSYRRYLDHIKGHQMGFMCDICGKPLFSEEALRRHRWGHQNATEMAEAIARGEKDPRRKHDPSLSFQCTTCGKVFSKKMLLRQHEKTHAENRERIVCTLCGKTFLPSGFISHQKYSCFPEGNEPPRVQCQLCPSTFKSVVLRARHMKYAHSTASVERPFKCHLCQKGFAANEHLQKHIKRHSDARPYLCRKGCGANYKTRKDCTRHEKKCEGSGTPMMRHKGRNDQLAPAVITPKVEPIQHQQVIITHVQGHVATGPNVTPAVIIQHETHHTGGQEHTQQQFNVYNIL